jgi:hypothetical protein
MWGFRVLIGKRKGLIWGCKEEEKYGTLWCSWVVCIVFMNGRRELEKKTHKGQDTSMLKNLYIY